MSSKTAEFCFVLILHHLAKGEKSYALKKINCYTLHFCSINQ